MVQLVKIYVSRYRNSCKCNRTLVMVVVRRLNKIEGVDFTIWLIFD